MNVSLKHNLHRCGIVCLLLLLRLCSLPKFASGEKTDIEGITVPDVRHVDGVQLKRNGHGIRSINFFGMNIKVYVAGLYSPKPLLSEEDVWGHVLDDDTESTVNKRKKSGKQSLMQLDFTFLRSVGKSKVISAWTQQLEHSVSHRYPNYEQDRDSFINMFANAIAYGGTQSVQLIGNNTVIVDQGIHKGTIPGKDFQKSFLSMWFGERAVAEDLKEGLLSGGRKMAAAVAI